MLSVVLAATADTGVALDLAARLAALTAVISSLEWLVCWRDLGDHGALSWKVGRLLRGMAPRTTAGQVLDRGFGSQATTVNLLVLRLICAVALVGGPMAGPGRGWLAGVTAIATLLMSLRVPFGTDGAERMCMVVLGAVALAAVSDSSLVQEAALWFIAGQGALAYLSAGVAKACAPAWRDGSAVAGVFRTVTYGHPLVSGAFERYPVLARVTAWAVIGGECAMPLVLVLPLPLAVALVGVGLVFHVVTAVLMGLNTFVWSFAATYVALLHCSGVVLRLRGGQLI